MNQAERRILSSRDLLQNQTAKPRSVSSFDGNLKFSSNMNQPTYVYKKHLTKNSLNTNSPRKADTYETMPSSRDLGSHLLSRVDMSNEFQNEVLIKSLREAQIRSESSTDFLNKQNSRITNASRDLKKSTSYLNAMKALQNKIRKLEEQLKFSEKDKLDLEEKYRNEIDVLSQKFGEERRMFEELENNLKSRLSLLQEELKDRERIIDNLSYENDRLRKTAHDIETERALETEEMLNDKGRIRTEYKDLERRFEERLRVEEEFKTKIIQLEYALGERENFISELSEKVGSLEKEKMELNAQFEHKITDLILKQKYAEEKNREIEDDCREEALRRKHKDEETEKEMLKLRMHIQELEYRNEQAERKVKDKEMELIDKSAQILKLKEEMDSVLQENEKTRAANDKTHSYAQDMAKINQRLLHSFRDKSDRNSVHQSLHQASHNVFSSALQQDTLVEDSLSPQQSGRFEMSKNKKITLKTPKSKDKNETISYHTKGWSMGSPNHREEGDSFFQGPKLTGEDLLVGSENLGRGNRLEEPRLRSAMKGRRTQNENREGVVDSLQHEMVIKEIIEVERETLELNKEYQRLNNDMTGMDRESNEYRNKKSRLEKIANKLHEKSVYLIHLKRKEEDILKRIKS